MAAGPISLFIASLGLITYPLVMKLTASAEATDLVKPIAEEAARAAAGILEDEKMRYWALVGAFCGSCMSVFAFRPQNAWELVGKWITSLFFAVCFMPAAIEYFNFAHSTSYVMALSAAGALVAWSLIQIVQPLIVSLASSKLGQVLKVFFNVGDSHSSTPTKRRRK